MRVVMLKSYSIEFRSHVGILVDCFRRIWFAHEGCWVDGIGLFPYALIVSPDEDAMLRLMKRNPDSPLSHVFGAFTHARWTVEHTPKPKSTAFIGAPSLLRQSLTPTTTPETPDAPSELFW